MFVIHHELSSGTYGLKNSIDGSQHLRIHELHISLSVAGEFYMGKSTDIISGTAVSFNRMCCLEKVPDSGVSVFEPISTNSSLNYFGKYRLSAYQPLILKFPVPIEIRPAFSFMYYSSHSGYISVYAEEY